MNNKYIQLGVAAAVLAGLLAALMFLRSAPAEAEPEAVPSEDAIYVIGGEDAEDGVAAVAVTNESGEYKLVPGSDGFIVEGWEKLSLDTYNLGLASDNAKAMAAKDIIAENASADELAMYGLNNPRAAVTVTNETGGTGAVLFGDNAPGGEGVYVKREYDNVVYLVSPATAEPFFKPAAAYVNKTVTATDPDFKGFDRIALSGEDYPEPIIIERTPETVVEAAGMVLGTHSIVSPIRAGVDYQRGLEPLNSVYGLLANDVVAVAEDASALAAYGLDKPAAAISVTGPADSPDMTFTLRVSAADADGNVRVARDSSPVVYEMPASYLPWLGLMTFDLMNRMPLVPNIDTVSSVKISLPGKTYTFLLSGEGDELKVSLDGAELPEVTKDDGEKATGTQNFRQFYQTLVSASYEEETDESPSQDAESLLRVEYAYRNGVDPDVARFYGGPVRRAFIAVNGEDFYLTSSAYVDRVIEDAEKIASGKAVKSFF